MCAFDLLGMQYALFYFLIGTYYLWELWDLPEYNYQFTGEVGTQALNMFLKVMIGYEIR